MGKELKPRNKKTRRFQKHTSFLIKSMLVAIGTVVTIYGTLYYKEQPVEYVKIENVKVDSKIIKMMKQDVVKMVRYSEVDRELEQGELFYTNDPHSSISKKCNKVGGKRGIACDSWGAFQFKIPTVQFYYKKLYGTELTEMEAMLIALDEDKATALAEDMIFKIEGAVWEWSGAQKNKAYLAIQIPLIRKMEATL